MLLLLMGQYPDGPLGGVLCTLLVSLLAVLFAFPVGVLLCLARLSPWRWLSWPVTCWIYLLRGIPLMMVVFSATGGVTGVEVGVAGGTAVLAQRVLEAVFGEDAVVRFRPHHFPFTEPSCEVDMQCFKCHGTGETAGQVCSTCHGEGWIELLGAGMVHPKVLEGCGIDTDVYSGWAFGIGLERTAMRRFKIADLRLIFENDVRFLEQF